MRRPYSVYLMMGALLVPACATMTATSAMWGEPYGAGHTRPGHVEWVREVDRHTEGNPSAGAAAGAVIGGILGGALTGRGAGMLLGATGGALVGAGESQGSRDEVIYEVAVQFDDGGRRVFAYRGHPPFHPGQPVVLTPHGLMARGTFGVSMPDEGAPSSTPQGATHDSPATPTAPVPEVKPPPPPTATPPPPPQDAASGQVAAPSGEWAFTDQYGWVWMPYGDAYTFTPDYDNGAPYMYVYYPATGWTWIEAPWLWGWGPRPHFRKGVVARFGWYGHGWGAGWRGHRATHYRGGFHRRRR